MSIAQLPKDVETAYIEEDRAFKRYSKHTESLLTEARAEASKHTESLLAEARDESAKLFAATFNTPLDQVRQALGLGEQKVSIVWQYGNVLNVNIIS